MSKLSEMIDRLVTERVAATIGELMGETEPISEPTVSVRPVLRKAVKGESTAPTTRSRRSFGNASYTVAVKGVDASVMTPGVYAHYKAASKGKAVKTMKEIVALVGRKDASAENAAESAIWWLRNHDKQGRRIDRAMAGRGKAILHNVVG